MTLPADLTLAQAAALLRQGEASPVELTRSALENIATHGAALNAFISVFAEQAMEVARATETLMAAGHYVGSLQGIPIALKDNVAVRGTRTTAGSKVLADWIPEEDATVTARLRQAGAILVGKTNMHEFAWGGTSANPHYGAVRNAWNPAHFPAGSSGGSAVAVAARCCLGAVGTDTGGSIRLPSAINGITGLRPTYGRVSNHGVIPLAWSMDTVGPMARTAEDCALMLQAMAGHDARDSGSASRACDDYPRALSADCRHLRIGIVPGYFFEHLQPPVLQALRDALDAYTDLGARLEHIAIPSLHGNISAQLTVEAAEPSAYHQRTLRERPGDYGDDVRALLDAGEMLLATHYIQAQRYRSLLRAELLAAFERVDVLICPTLPFAATPLGATRVAIENGQEEDMLSAIMQFTGIASLAGLPALSVPCGFDDNGLPIGMQIIGRPFAEATVLRAGHAFQQATDFHRRMPALA